MSPLKISLFSSINKGHTALSIDLYQSSKSEVSSWYQMNVNIIFFCLAVQKGFIDIAEILLAHHADVNYQSSSGKNAVMVAAYAGSCFFTIIIFL